MQRIQRIKNKKKLSAHTEIHTFMQTGAKHTHTQTKYTNTVYTHTHKLLSLSGTEDRGIESIHVWRGNRACGDSGVVRASRGSQ